MTEARIRRESKGSVWAAVVVRDEAGFSWANFSAGGLLGVAVKAKSKD